MDNTKKQDPRRLDSKEFLLPETTFVRDIDNRVFQGIVLKCLSNINDIGLIDGNFIDSLLGRQEGVKGIYTEQDPKNHTISVKVEVRIAYGASIPQKAEEIQMRIIEELTRLTGLHVSCVHVVFKSLLTPQIEENNAIDSPSSNPVSIPRAVAEEYSDVF